MKRIFLSNGGSDASLFPRFYRGTPDRAYNYLYAAFAASGQYQLVSEPGQADVVLELALNSPMGYDNGHIAIPLPTFKLTVYDRPTHYVLWTLSQIIPPASLKKTYDKNFDTALDSVLSQFEAITK